MKFALAALITATAFATTSSTSVRSMDNYGVSCYGDWEFEDCSGLYRRHDYCGEVCGWWYSQDADETQSDDLWATCDDISTWSTCWVSQLVMASRKVAEKRGSNSCDNPFYYDERIQLKNRYLCNDEYGPTGCGQYTWNDQNSTEYWLTCAEFDEIVESLREPCVKEWEYDAAVDAQWRHSCDNDSDQGDGWYFRFEEGGEELWVERTFYDALTADYGEDECDNDWQFDARTGEMRKEACEDELEAAGVDCAWFIWHPQFSMRFLVTCEQYDSHVANVDICTNQWQGSGYNQYRDACDWELMERNAECGRFHWSYEIHGEVFEEQECDE